MIRSLWATLFLVPSVLCAQESMPTSAPALGAVSSSQPASAVVSLDPQIANLSKATTGAEATTSEAADFSKSYKRAFRLSLVPTLAGSALLGTGLGMIALGGNGNLRGNLIVAGAAAVCLGPSLGQAYAGRWGRAILGPIGRLGLPLATGALGIVFGKVGGVVGFGAGVAGSGALSVSGTASLYRQASKPKTTQGDPSISLFPTLIVTPKANNLGLSVVSHF